MTVDFLRLVLDPLPMSFEYQDCCSGVTVPMGNEKFQFQRRQRPVAIAAETLGVEVESKPTGLESERDSAAVVVVAVGIRMLGTVLVPVGFPTSFDWLGVAAVVADAIVAVEEDNIRLCSALPGSLAVADYFRDESKVDEGVRVGFLSKRPVAIAAATVGSVGLAVHICGFHHRRET